MIVPSIDLMTGQAVQLIGGKQHALDAGDPRPIAEHFALAGEIAAIDLDAALGTASNAPLVRGLLPLARCRVGGGIRTMQAAVDWLDAGAAKIIIGTAATPGLLSQLPRERLIAALDADSGQVVVEGWRKHTGESILDRMHRLQGLVSGFLVTFVEREGRMSGLGGSNLELVPELVRVAAECGARVTIAGGVTTAEDIARLDSLGADAQVGMALYTNRLDLADAIAAPLRSDRADGLWPTIVADELGITLGLAYSSAESLRDAVAQRRGIYHSRSRGIWTKGNTSGDIQQLLRIDLDCDRDALRFTVRQHGRGFCHAGTRTCWGNTTGLSALEHALGAAGSRSPPPARSSCASFAHSRAGSYTARLLSSPGLLDAKLVEEARELATAGTPQDAIHEAADLLYFTLVAMRRAGITLADVAHELDRRALRITRRGGDAKSGAAG